MYSVRIKEYFVFAVVEPKKTTSLIYMSDQPLLISLGHHTSNIQTKPEIQMLIHNSLQIRTILFSRWSHIFTYDSKAT